MASVVSGKMSYVQDTTGNVANTKMSYANVAAIPKKEEKKLQSGINLHTARYVLHPYLSIYDTLPKHVIDNPLFDFYHKHDVVLVNEVMHRCHITTKPIRSTLALRPTKVWILNQSTFRLREHSYYNLPSTCAFKLHFVHPDGTIRNPFPNIWVVPRLVTQAQPASATTRLLAARFCAKRLHMDAMSELIRYMGGPRYYDQIQGIKSFKAIIGRSTEYTTIQGPISQWISEDDENENGVICYSLGGIINLIEQGVMDLAYHDESRNQVVAYTTDSFFHVFPDGEHSTMFILHKTVEKMMQRRADIINSMKLFCK